MFKLIYSTTSLFYAAHYYHSLIQSITTSIIYVHLLCC